MRKFISKLFHAKKRAFYARVAANQKRNAEAQEKQQELLLFLAQMTGYIYANHNDLLNRLVDDIRSGKIDVEQAANTLYETMQKEA